MQFIFIWKLNFFAYRNELSTLPLLKILRASQTTSRHYINAIGNESKAVCRYKNNAAYVKLLYISIISYSFFVKTSFNYFYICYFG